MSKSQPGAEKQSRIKPSSLLIAFLRKIWSKLILLPSHLQLPLQTGGVSPISSPILILKLWRWCWSTFCGTWGAVTAALSFHLGCAGSPSPVQVESWDNREGNLHRYSLKVSSAAFEIFAHYVMAKYLQVFLLDVSQSMPTLSLNLHRGWLLGAWWWPFLTEHLLWKLQPLLPYLLCWHLTESFILIKLLWSSAALLLSIDPINHRTMESTEEGREVEFLFVILPRI